MAFWGKKYLHRHVLGGNPVFDPIVDGIVNSCYVKFHILIPKDPLTKVMMVIFINGGIWIGKVIYKNIKIYLLNQFVDNQIHKLDRLKPIKYFDKNF